MTTWPAAKPRRPGGSSTTCWATRNSARSGSEPDACSRSGSPTSSPTSATCCSPSGPSRRNSLPLGPHPGFPALPRGSASAARTILGGPVQDVADYRAGRRPRRPLGPVVAGLLVVGGPGHVHVTPRRVAHELGEEQAGGDGAAPPVAHVLHVGDGRDDLLLVPLPQGELPT